MLHTHITGLRRRTAPAAAVCVAALLLSACGSDAPKPSSAAEPSAADARHVAVKLTDEGCDPPVLEIAPGPVTFDVLNAGTAHVSEFQVLAGARVLGRKQDLDRGVAGSVSLTLRPGSYTLSCPGGRTTATAALTVTGGGAATDRTLEAAVAGYREYVASQSAELLRRTKRFAVAIKAGDLARAKRMFATSRAPYEAIEPVAANFGGLDPSIDARINDIAAGAPWTGFHRIEKALFKDRTTKGMGPVADRLVADIEQLIKLTAGLRYQPKELANGANSLLDEVSRTKITGEEDRYSHTDLSDFEANISGSQAAFGLLAPAVRTSDPVLVRSISARFAAVERLLDGYRSGSGFVSYLTVDETDRRRLSQAVDALAEPLSQLASRLGS